ncbi:DUF397 domain-containing protein (plasmid) [Streptomyces castrisilvae]|uniref:DUF397 domain-containing protein n=2 Tax=Streptomyces castrisilvae TaxID=3033811 RepID=A0ABY9HVK1_9ACTN|nr:DUF397 domain-containing protein [Streptomyces sp. Mut1]WLQ38358.1 DUF397 domain-containing protein [Streptomyces sp. Mut1]WLQ38575.1 DUF397 domain-containing protein [Streptomyces sp. Mut1]
MNCWHKSSYSTEFEDACVEAARAAGGVLVHDTKDLSHHPFTTPSPTRTTYLKTLDENIRIQLRHPRTPTHWGTSPGIRWVTWCPPLIQPAKGPEEPRSCSARRAQ